MSAGEQNLADAVIEPPLWIEGASTFAHEREALAFVKARLPSHEPYRAWTNVEFIAGDGTINEIDLLVVTPQGFFLVEIKSYPGVLLGDGQYWRLRRPNGSEKHLINQRILANSKAKRLRSLLARQPALRNQPDAFIAALVFLSSPDLDCRRHDIARSGVTSRAETALASSCSSGPNTPGPTRNTSAHSTDSGAYRSGPRLRAATTRKP